MPPNAGPACHAPRPALLEVAVGKTKVGPTPTRNPVSSRLGHGRIATSKNGRSPNSVRVPPRELGTVTNANVGRSNWLNGSRLLGGMRGINGRTMSWLVSSFLKHAWDVQGPGP